MLSIDIKNNNINFEYEFDENRKYIYSDENRIMQIIKNFLSNSIKFTKNGNILLKMEDNEDCVEISVKDNGIGIEEKKIICALCIIYRIFLRLLNSALAQNAIKTMYPNI